MSVVHRVIRSEELPPATPEEPGIRRVTAGSADVLVARLSNGEVVAFGTICPHQLTDLEEAYFFDDRLRCPRHQYLYDPHTGENIVPAGDARLENLWKLKPGYLPVHRVEERDGWVWVDEPALPPPPGYDPERERRPPGASPSEAPGDPGGVDAPAGSQTLEHPARMLRVRQGAFFELRVPTAPRPGFTWNVKVTGGVTVVEEGFVPGDQPRHRVRVLARRAGDGTITCAYARPWDDTPAEVRSYIVRIVAPDPP